MLYADPFLTVYCCLLAALLGACMGSFLNCAAWRIVHGESVLRGRSHCDACGHVLAVRDLIPVVSYLAAHGRCRYCGAKLSRRHVLAEAVSALVFVTLPPAAPAGAGRRHRRSGGGRGRTASGAGDGEAAGP